MVHPVYVCVPALGLNIFLADTVFDALEGADLPKKLPKVITSYDTSGSSELLNNSLTLIQELCMSGKVMIILYLVLCKSVLFSL